MTGEKAVGDWLAFFLFSLTVIGFMWKMSRDVQQLKDSQDRKIDKANTEQDGKRARIYERIDEVKGQNEKTYMRKDLCEVTRTAITEQINTGFRNLENRLDTAIGNVESKIQGLSEAIRYGKQ